MIKGSGSTWAHPWGSTGQEALQALGHQPTTTCNVLLPLPSLENSNRSCPEAPGMCFFVDFYCSSTAIKQFSDGRVETWVHNVCLISSTPEQTRSGSALGWALRYIPLSKTNRFCFPFLTLFLMPFTDLCIEKSQWRQKKEKSVWSARRKAKVWWWYKMGLSVVYCGRCNPGSDTEVAKSRQQDHCKGQQGPAFHLTFRCQGAEFEPCLYFSESKRTSLPLPLSSLRTGWKAAWWKLVQGQVHFQLGAPFLEHRRGRADQAEESEGLH